MKKREIKNSCETVPLRYLERKQQYVISIVYYKTHIWTDRVTLLSLAVDKALPRTVSDVFL
jgi:hypothetical protein